MSHYRSANVSVSLWPDICSKSVAAWLPTSSSSSSDDIVHTADDKPRRHQSRR
jgi:hypothetical protein